MVTLHDEMTTAVEEFWARMKEKEWEEKRKDKVEGLLDFIIYEFRKLDEDRDWFSDSELKETEDCLFQIKEKLEKEKDTIPEEEFYSLSNRVDQIDDKRIKNVLNAEN